MRTQKEFRVFADSGPGVRLDVFLARQIRDFTRSQFQRFIDKKQVTVNGAFPKPSLKLRAGDRVAVDIDIPEAEPVRPEPIPLVFLHVDDDLAVINKPSGLVVHPGAGRRTGTLVGALLHHFPEIAAVGPEERSGIVHRLDAETSGAIVVARREKAYLELKRQFKDREVKKIYLALVWGALAESEGTLDWPIGRHWTDGQRYSVTTRKPRVAITHFRVLRRLDGFTYLEVHPHTGRTHQIRVHLAAAGHPVCGDRRYGGQKGRPKFPRLFLHAHLLGFRHPTTGRLMEFRAPLPPELEAVLAGLPGGPPESLSS